MEILLVDNYPFPATRFTSSDTLLKCSVANYNPRTVRGKELHEEYIKKVLAASAGKKHCIHINKNPADASDYMKCLVRLHGFFPEDFETLWMEGLRLRIQLAFMHRSGQFSPLLMCAEIPILKALDKSLAPVDPVNEACITNGVFLEVTDVAVNYWNNLFKGNLNSNSNPYISGWATITLLSDCNKLHATQNDQLAIFKNPSIGIARMNKTILDSKLYSDVIISAKDGSEHNCNKVFLAAQSSVLQAMLETDVKESKTNKVDMKDMTSNGVKALLEYIYTFELDQAIKCCIALELLQAGHKYDIESLEKDVSSLILNQGEDWFSVDVAFSLFLFTRKEDSMKDVKIKAASMLMKKPTEFLECKAYLKKRQENPAEAADTTQELFCLAFMK